MTDKQPDPLTLAQDLMGIFISEEIDVIKARQIATLLRTQHAAIERKDALLKQALETLTLHQGAHPAAYRQAIDAITKELQ